MNSVKEQNSEDKVNLHDTSNSSNTTPSTLSAGDGGHDNVAFEREKPAMETKDNEMELVQMNTANKNGDTFTQYYLPVNTHKKLLRGEKLYVTRDSRSKGLSWQKIVLCGVIWLLIALIFVLSALAATGVILGSSSVSSGEVELHIQSNDSLNEFDNSTFLPLDTEIPYPIATYPHVGDASNSKVLLGSFAIVNLRYSDLLANQSSKEFLSLQRQLENELYLVFSPLNVRGVSVDELTSGSVVVHATLSWPLSRSASPVEANEYFFSHLNLTSGFLGRFLVDMTSVEFKEAPPPSSTEITRPSGYGKALGSDWPTTDHTETTEVWPIFTWLTTTPRIATTKKEITTDELLPTLQLHSFNASSPTHDTVFVNPTSNYTETPTIELHTFNIDHDDDITVHTQTDEGVSNHTLWFSRMSPPDSHNATAEISNNETTVEETITETTVSDITTTVETVDVSETEEANTTETELFTMHVVFSNRTALGVNSTVDLDVHASTEISGSNFTEMTTGNETEIDLTTTTEFNYFSTRTGISTETNLQENGTAAYNVTDLAVHNVTDSILDTTTQIMQNATDEKNETELPTTTETLHSTTVLEIEYNVTELETKNISQEDFSTTVMIATSNVTEFEAESTMQTEFPTTTDTTTSNITEFEMENTTLKELPMTMEIATSNVTEFEVESTTQTELPTTTETATSNITEFEIENTTQKELPTTMEMATSNVTELEAESTTQKELSTTTEMAISSVADELEANVTTEWNLPTTSDMAMTSTEMPITNNVAVLDVNSTTERDLHVVTDATHLDSTTSTEPNVTAAQINNSMETDTPTTEVMTTEILHAISGIEIHDKITTEAEPTGEVSYDNTQTDSSHTEVNLHTTREINDSSTEKEEIVHSQTNRTPDITTEGNVDNGSSTVTEIASDGTVNSVSDTITTSTQIQEMTSASTQSVTGEIANEASVEENTMTSIEARGGIVFGVNTTDERKSWWLNETSTLVDEKKKVDDITKESPILTHETKMSELSTTQSTSFVENAGNSATESTTSQIDETTTSATEKSTVREHEITAEPREKIAETTQKETPEIPHLTTTDSSEIKLNAFVATVVEVTTTNDDISTTNINPKFPPKKKDGISYFDKGTEKYPESVELTTTPLTSSEASEVVYTNNEDNANRINRRRRQMYRRRLNNRRRPLNRRQ